MGNVIIALLKPRTIFAFMFYGTYCWLVFNKINPPEGLTNIVLMMLAFYFGQKNGAKNEA